MITRRTALGFAAALAPLAALRIAGGSVRAAVAGETAMVTIGYVDRADDPYYGIARANEALLSATRVSPFAGAELAVADAKFVGQAADVQFAIERVTLGDDEDATAAVQRLSGERHAVAAVLDLPEDETLKLARAVAALPMALFNARHRATGLRQAACDTHLFHTIPSWDMLEDGLAQILIKRNWKRVLVIESDDPDDKAVSAAFQLSAGKFGMIVAAVKSFVPGEDPRDRDRNNPRLITGDSDYDVVFVADHQGDFAGKLFFNTFLPRPVVGAAGLAPLAWHPLWDRDGAAQLQGRFSRRAKRPMTELDWAAWVSVRAVVEAAIGGKARNSADVLKALLSQNLALELYKGQPGSFRTWNRQLRQPILLATDGAVLAVAPVEGMLHRTNTLDTLGLDDPEFHCR